MTEGNSKKEGYLNILLFSKGYEESCIVNIESAYRNYIFSYNCGEGCLRYLRPHNLNVALTLSSREKQLIFKQNFDPLVAKGIRLVLGSVISNK